MLKLSKIMDVSDDISVHEKKSPRKEYKIDFETIMKEIGGFGKYQILLVSLAYWVAIPCGMNQVASVFLAASPDYRWGKIEVTKITLKRNL